MTESDADSVTVEIALGTLDDRTIPAMFPRPDATPDDSQLLDRWRVAVYRLKGYTAVARGDGNEVVIDTCPNA